MNGELQAKIMANEIPAATPASQRKIFFCLRPRLMNVISLVLRFWGQNGSNDFNYLTACLPTKTPPSANLVD